MTVEDADRLELGVCAVDIDGIGTSGNKAFDPMRAREALRNFQNMGLKVIAVSQHSSGAYLRETTDHGLDVAALLHVRCLNEVVIDLTKVAYEYNCWMVTNGDLAALCHDWRLPPKRQRWLQNVRQEFQVKYSFDASGAFRVELPAKVRNRQLPGGGDVAGFRQDGYPSTPSEGFTEQPTWGGVQATRYQNVRSATPSPQVRPALAPPMPQQPPSMVLDEAQLCRWTTDTDSPSAGVLWLPGQGSQLGVGALLCLVCEEKSSWLFPYACELSGSLVHHDNLIDIEDDPELRPYVASRAATSQWSSDIFEVVIAKGGSHNGLRAIGLGNNRKCRQRAARIALAVTVRAMDPNPWQEVKPVDDLDDDRLLYAFVQRARRLFMLRAEGADCAGTDAVPPPPPGPAPATTANPPPPPPTHSQPQHGGSDKLNLMHKVVEAHSVYEAELDGYLSLRPGDKVCVKYHTVEAGTAQDRYGSYAFGLLIDGPSFRVPGAPGTLQGWFPFELVQCNG